MATVTITKLSGDCSFLPFFVHDVYLHCLRSLEVFGIENVEKTRGVKVDFTYTLVMRSLVIRVSVV